MEKKIRTVSIIALVISAIAVVAFLLCLLLQGTLLPLLYSSMIADAGFVFPAAAAVYILGMALVALLLCLCAGKVRGSTWPEILFILLAGVAVPVLNGLASTVQNMVLGMKGPAQMAAVAAMNALCNFPRGISQMAMILILVACGMGIAWKSMLRQNPYQ